MPENLMASAAFHSSEKLLRVSHQCASIYARQPHPYMPCYRSACRVKAIQKEDTRVSKAGRQTPAASLLARVHPSPSAAAFSSLTQWQTLG